MTDWLPGAIRLEATKDGGAQDRSYPPRLVLHTTEGGGTVQSLWVYYHSSTFWPHFTADVVNKQLAQHIPYSRGGRALSHTDATQTNDAHCIQIEIIGYSAQAGAWPSDQADWLGHVLAPMLDELGIHRAAPTFVAYPASAGLHAKQRMSEQAWAGFNGVCGHQHVPENDHGDPGAFNIARFLAAATTKPAPPEVKVVPQHQPPISVEPVVADLACPTGGAWTVTDSGAIYAWGGARTVRGANGMPWFVGRHAARLEAPNAQEHAAGKLLALIATSGERYALPT